MNKGILLVVVIAAAVGGYYAVTHASGGMDLDVSEKE